MSGFRTLIHEIHRRSVWQVLGIYAVASWVVLQVVEVLTESAGLPDWTPGFAIVLLLIGLPVCLATAVVQEGLPGGDSGSRMKRAGAVDAAFGPDTPWQPAGAARALERAGEAGAATDPERVPRTPASDGAANLSGASTGAHHRLLTWRNALLGGAGAFALLGLAVTGYFIMWSTGVGPVGSLVAQGVLDERDPVVLADFGDGTTQAGLGDVVTEALRVDLVESPVLALVPPSRVDEVLALMGRDSDEPLVPELAREVAVREGFKAVIQGEIAAAGNAYVLSASVVTAETGDVLKAFRETARSDDEVVDAIDKLSQRIRESIGESLRTIRAGEPLERVTTASLEALQKLTEAERAEERGDYTTALGLLEEAVVLDPGFAMAYRKIAVLHFNLGTDRARAREAAVLAYENRDRLTERERYLAEAYHHSRVTLDENAEILAYRNALRVAPDDGSALNNLALTLMNREEYEEAKALLERALAGPGESSVANFNRVRVALFLADVEGARAAQERYESRYPNHLFRRWSGSLVALYEGHPDSVHAAARARAEDENTPPSLRATAGLVSAAFDLSEGRFEEAERHVHESILAAGRLQLPGDALELTFDSAEIRRDFRGEAVDRDATRAALERWRFDEIPAADRPWGRAVEQLAWSGQPARARTLYDRWSAELSEEERAPSFDRDRRVALAQLRIAEGDAGAAVEALESVRRDEACERCLIRELGDALERAGRTADAAATWERLLPAPDYLDFWPADRVLALGKLGPLYEALGDSARAAVAYEAFADAWSEADPDLLPRVERARERAAALTARSGGGP